MFRKPSVTAVVEYLGSAKGAWFDKYMHFVVCALAIEDKRCGGCRAAAMHSKKLLAFSQVCSMCPPAEVGTFATVLGASRRTWRGRAPQEVYT